MNLLSFDEAIEQSNQYNTRHLLLGNGFSIACRPDIFVYKKLFEQADFTKLPDTAKKVFLVLNTQDFEKVIYLLQHTRAVLNVYQGVTKETLENIANDAEGLKELLVHTIASSHPDHPSQLTENEYKSCRMFLSQFNKIYSLNYDLLLYWVQMHEELGSDLECDDGFRKSDEDFDAEYVVWDSNNAKKQNTFYLHGALHYFDTGPEIQKYTWINTGIRLIEQIRTAINKNHFPIFVSEGTSKQKIEKIKHNDYLSKALRSFNEIGGCLFIYGHSLAKNDDHVLKSISKGKIDHLFVSIYGPPDSEENKSIIRRANELNLPKRKKPLQVSFYDALSAKIWTN